MKKKKLRALEGGSFIKGELPEGCKICRKGAELFFFVTGKCCENCFYCSLARAKRGKDIVLANERPVTSFSSVVQEVLNMNALGAAITGGDPLAIVETTADYITKMKKQFGKKFHIHLYTSGRLATQENLQKLAKAGLDEIRFHPQNKEQEQGIAEALNYSWKVGAEIPVIPGKKKKILKFLDYLESLERVKFCNLNELEATEANWEKLQKKNFKLVSEESSAIAGSESLGLKILEETDYSFSLHYCSSYMKDALQFRKRLQRTAEIVRKPYEEIQDGMLVKAVMTPPDFIIADEIIDKLIEEYEIDPEMIALQENQRTIELSWYAADVLKDILKTRFNIEEIKLVFQYPTYGRIVIAQGPLKALETSEEAKSNEEEK